MSATLLWNHLPLLVLLAGVTLFEIRTFMVPDTAIVVGTVAGLTLSYLYGSGPWYPYWIAMLAAPLLLFSVGRIYEKRSGEMFIGFGLLKLFLVTGAFLGLPLQGLVLLFFLIAIAVMMLAEKRGLVECIHGTPLVTIAVVVALCLAYACDWETFHEVTSSVESGVEPDPLFQDGFCRS